MNDSAAKLIRQVYLTTLLEETEQVKKDLKERTQKLALKIRPFLDNYKEMEDVTIGIDYLINDDVLFKFPYGVLVTNCFLEDLGIFLELEQKEIGGYVKESDGGYYYEVIYHIDHYYVED